MAMTGALPAGCAKPVRPEAATAAEVDSDEDLDHLWSTALDVLQKVDFLPDRQDRATGVITCFPTTSMQWHEPWRQDVVTGYDLLESSMHTLQRRATVRFVKGERWTVEMQIDIYRLSRAETQITTASSVLHGFSSRLPTAEGTGLVAGENWVLLGRDGELEQRLLNRILIQTGASL